MFLFSLKASHTIARNSCLRRETQSSAINPKDFIMERMVIHQPRPMMEIQNSHDWGSGICDCCEDIKTCCFAFWCCPCFACMTSKDFGEPLCLPLLECFRSCISPVTLSMRSTMRERYKIEGSIAKDCVCATFCAACVWCQMSREMQRRKIQVVLVNAKTS
ncbi:cornifelin homolog B-like [Girardinichthys multiradiatus]|uniref:cornifelin homolog B-like n=1 Tax=Girardinichthys multiradiatus TaxID=208333 RepID=UPI001FADF587|nr:cornifelin homolog B-like [Girardinichthys multiradiatus]